MAEKKVRIRWKRVVASGVALLLLLAFPFLTWLMRSGLDQQLLTRALSDASGMKVSFASYSLSFGGTASLEQLKVEFAGEEFLTAEGLTASFSWWSLIRRQPEIEDLKVQSPKLVLTEPLLDALRKRPEGGGSELAIDFTDASVTYLNEETNLTLDQLDGRYSEGKVEVTQKDSFNGSIAWDQDTHTYKFQEVPLALIGRLTGQQLPEGKAQLDFVQKEKRFEGITTVESGVLNGKAQAVLELTETGVSGTLETEGLTVTGYQVGPSKVPFRWDGTTFSVEKATLANAQGQAINVDGQLSEKSANLSLRKDNLTVRLAGVAPPFQLDAQWGDTSLIQGTLSLDPWSLKITNLNGGYLMRLNDIDGKGFDFSGALTWAGALEGSLTSPGGDLEGQKVGQTTLKLKADSEAAVEASGTCTVAGRPLSIEARLQDKVWHLSAEGGKLPARLFKKSLGGTVDLSAKTTYPGGTGNFNITYSGDEQWPMISGTGSITGDEVVFRDFKLPRFNPPVVGSGTYHISNGSIALEAALKGQKLTELWKPSPVAGKLFGTVKVSGKESAPQPSFQGELRETKWQGTDFGTVAVSATDGSMKATLQNFSLDSVPELKPYFTGTGTVVLEGLPPTLSATADFPQVHLKGHPLGQLKAKLKVQEQKLVISSLNLPMMSMSGSVSPGKINLGGEIKDLNLATLPLPKKVSGQARGNFTVEGSPENPRGRFKGTVGNLIYEEMALGNLPLDATINGSKVEAEVSGMAVESVPPISKALPALKGVLNLGLTLGDKPLVVGRLSKGQYADKPLPPISTRLSIGEKAIQIQSLTLEQTPPITLSGRFKPESGDFQLSSNLDRTNLSPLLELLPEKPPLKGSLSGKVTVQGNRSTSKVDFAGSGQDISVGEVALGSIPQLNLNAGTGGDFMLQVDDMSASSIAPLRGLYPNLQGKVKFRARREAQGRSIGLSAELTKASLPDISLRADWNKNTLQLNSLKAALHPPVELKGSVQNGQVNIAGQLAGQSLRELMLLGGSQPPSDVAAHLAGTFKLTGPLSNPTATLVGPVTNMLYRNSQLGSGELDLAVNQRLSGELRLNTPYDATLADAAPGSVTQVPIINSILKTAVKARITAVKFAGTPSNPQVTPVVVGVGVAGSNQVNLPDLPNQLPGVLEQNGVKLPVLKDGGAKIKIPGTNQSIKIRL